jgi:hypothetical protein
MHQGRLILAYVSKLKQGSGCQRPELLWEMKERSFRLAKEALDTINLLKKSMRGAGLSLP